MTDKLREAAQMALDVLDKLNKDGWILADFEDEVCASIETLRAELAQPEQEPVAWLYEGDDVYGKDVCLNEDIFEEQKPNCIPLYTSAPHPETEPVGNTLTFMTRAIFNIVADHQEINGGYFIADGDVAAFVDRLAKVINSTFEPLKHKGSAPPQREWQGLTDEEIETIIYQIKAETMGVVTTTYLARAIEKILKGKNND